MSDEMVNKYNYMQSLMHRKSEAIRKKTNAERGIEALQDVIRDYDSVLEAIERELRDLLESS